jgi:hypothetical protein
MVAAMGSAANASAARPARAPALVPVDGGANYYARFSHGLPTSRSYFPIGVWASYGQTQSNIDKDKAAGFNLYLWPSDSGQSLSSFAANGMKALLDSDWYSVPGIGTASANAGYFLGDEEDMKLGPGAGYTEMQRNADAAPNDGRVTIANYSKGVLLWETDAEAERFVNDFQDITLTDLYWFTDPYQVPTMDAPDWFPETGTVSTPQIRRAANYGYQIDRMRQLDAMDGQRQPIWAFVESGWPFTQTASQGARTIAPAEMRAAVWQSLIAGARGIIYFDTSFGGPCQRFHINRDTSGCYTAIQAELTRTNSQITQLAPVLNSPTVSSGWSQRRGTTAMVKWVKAKKRSCKSNRKKCKKAKGKKAAGAKRKRCKKGKEGCGKVVTGKGNLFVFAGSAGSSVNGRFTLACAGRTHATVVGENRTVPVRRGTFRDRFADGNAIHIYRVPRGPKCASPRQATVIPVDLPRSGGRGGGHPAPSSSNHLFRSVIAAMAVLLLGLAAAYGRRRSPGGVPPRPRNRSKRGHRLGTG